MKTLNLIQAISPDLQKEIVQHMYVNHKPAFRMVQGQLATARKLRPVFLQSKTREDQINWLLTQIRMKVSETMADQVIQLWLLKGQQKMLAAFLDATGIEHKEGEVEDLPEEITKEKATDGIKALLKDFPAEHAAIYLNMFQRQKEGGWPGLTEAMAAFPELELKAAA
jgi:hypothetical protein